MIFPLFSFFCLTILCPVLHRVLVVITSIPMGEHVLIIRPKVILLRYFPTQCSYRNLFSKQTRSSVGDTTEAMSIPCIARLPSCSMEPSSASKWRFVPQLAFQVYFIAIIFLTSCPFSDSKRPWYIPPQLITEDTNVRGAGNFGSVTKGTTSSLLLLRNYNNNILDLLYKANCGTRLQSPSNGCIPLPINKSSFQNWRWNLYLPSYSIDSWSLDTIYRSSITSGVQI